MKKIFLLILLLAIRTMAQTPRLSDEILIFKTDCGDMAVALYPDQAPKHTEQILKLARHGVYTHTLFFRNDVGYVAQIENFNMRAQPLNAEQTALVQKIPAEFNGIHHRRGILSMARFDDPNSAETSFSFVLGEAPNLDGQYTVFGEVIKGLDVLDEIEKLPPRSVYIQSAEVIPMQDLSKLELAPAHAPPKPMSDALQIFIFTVAALVLLVAFSRLSSRS